MKFDKNIEVGDFVYWPNLPFLFEFDLVVQVYKNYFCIKTGDLDKGWEVVNIDNSNKEYKIIKTPKILKIFINGI